MTDKEIQLLKEIDDLHQKLLQEPNGTWRGRVYLEPSSYAYVQNVKLLIDKVQTLRDDEDIDADYANVLDQHINSYLGREVKYVEQNISNHNSKENAKWMNNANYHLNVLMTLVFQKINELKQNGEL